MDIDTEVNGLAHEIWAMSQNTNSIEYAVLDIMRELMKFAAIIQKEEREACAIVCRYYIKHQNYPVWADADEYERGVIVACKNLEEIIRERSNKEK